MAQHHATPQFAHVLLDQIVRDIQVLQILKRLDTFRVHQPVYFQRLVDCCRCNKGYSNRVPVAAQVDANQSGAELEYTNVVQAVEGEVQLLHELQALDTVEAGDHVEGDVQGHDSAGIDDGTLSMSLLDKSMVSAVENTRRVRSTCPEVSPRPERSQY